MTRVLLLCALFACSNKSSPDESAPPEPRPKHKVELQIGQDPHPERKQLTLRVYIVEWRVFKPTIELTGTKKPISVTGEGDSSMVTIEVPFDQLGPENTEYKVVYDASDAHGEATFKAQLAPKVVLAVEAVRNKFAHSITGTWPGVTGLDYASFEVSPERKLVLALAATPNATLTVEGETKPTTAEPVRFELDIVSRIAELTLADNVVVHVKLEDAAKQVLNRDLTFSARGLLEVLAQAKPGPFLFPGETAGPHHAIGNDVDEKALGAMKLREIDRFVRHTSTAKELEPCRYVPEGVKDPKEFERYTIHREVVTSTVSVYDRRAGKVIASKSWTGKPEKCPSSVEAEKGSFGQTLKFTAGTDAEIAAFLASVR